MNSKNGEDWSGSVLRCPGPCSLCRAVCRCRVVGGDHGGTTAVLHDLDDNATQPHVTRQRCSVISKVLFGMTGYSSDAAGRIGHYALSMQKTPMCARLPCVCACRSVHVRLTWSNSVFRHCGNFGGCAVAVAGRAPCVSLTSLSLSLSINMYLHSCFFHVISSSRSHRELGAHKPHNLW